MNSLYIIYILLALLALVAAFVLGRWSAVRLLGALVASYRADVLFLTRDLDAIKRTRHLAGKKAWEKRKANLNDSSTAPEDFSGLAVIDTEPSANLSITIDAGEGAE